MTQYRGWHGEADYAVVDTHDGTRWTVVRSRKGRITDHFYFKDQWEAISCVNLNLELDHDKAVGR
jgi:hypothetical protein